MSVFVFYCNTNAIVNLDFLKEICDKEILKGARIFKRLFKLVKDKDFKNQELNKNIFIDFKIKFNEWSQLIQFLKLKKPSLLKDYYHDTKIITNLIDICNKFGGIPYFDKYLDKLSIDDNIYNPQSPKEDRREVYYWKLIGLDKIDEFKDYENWILTDNILSITKSKFNSYIFARKKKSLGITREEKVLNNNFIEEKTQNIKLDNDFSYDPTFNVSGFD